LESEEYLEYKDELADRDHSNLPKLTQIIAVTAELQIDQLEKALLFHGLFTNVAISAPI
jgi:hypothetical protein